jgi:hypothetical protein
LAREFKLLLKAHRLEGGVSLYTLRHAVTKAMYCALGMKRLELKYITGHAIRDLLAHYVPFDPVGAMQPYFASIRLLLDTITQRAIEVGLPT